MGVAKKAGLDAHHARSVATATVKRKGEGWRGFTFQRAPGPKVPAGPPLPAPLPEVFETGNPRPAGGTLVEATAPPRPAPTALRPGARPIEPAPSRPDGNILIV